MPNEKHQTLWKSDEILSNEWVVWINQRINDIAKSANFSHAGAGAMEFCSLDGGKDGEHSVVSFVEIFIIYAFATQETFFFGMEQFERVNIVIQS